MGQLQFHPPGVYICFQLKHQTVKIVQSLLYNPQQNAGKLSHVVFLLCKKSQHSVIHYHFLTEWFDICSVQMELQLSPFINKEIHLSSEGAGVIMDHSLIMGWGASNHGMGGQKKLDPPSWGEVRSIFFFTLFQHC